MKRLLVSSFACLLACGGSRPADPERPAPSTADPVEVSDDLTALAGANQLGFDLYSQLRAREGNLVFSPASVHVALSMTYAGAREDTAAEMRQVLRVTGEDEAHHRALGDVLRIWASTKSATLRVANRIYAHQSAPLEAPFVALTGDVYGAPIELVDFANETEAARLEINRWVAAQTEDRIQDLLAQLDPLTRMVLVNAVYFRGTWQTEFDASQTAPKTFHVGGHEAVDVPSMTITSSFAWAQLPKLRVLEMPYAGGELSMVWLLPETRDGLDGLERELSSESLASWRAATSEVEVEVQIPRFRLEPPSIELDDALIALGMPLAFDQDRANFQGIAVLRGGLHIDAVVHKAFIEVNEEGTEAAAATAVVMATRSASAEPTPEPPRFIAEHPFIFALVDRRTGLVLFLGRVVDPR
jgi:serpin B